MNKLVKGSIAGAAGIALLLGGGATLASWNSTISAGSGPITAGTLDIAAGPAGVWTDQDNTVITLANYKIVPGDVLTYTATFDVTAIGDNLTATAAVAPGSITAATTGNTTANAALAQRLLASTTYTVDGQPSAGATINSGTDTIEVSATITWTDNAADNDARNGAVNLSNFAVTLTQS